MRKVNKEDRASDYERVKELLDSMNVRYREWGYKDRKGSDYISIEIDESAMISLGGVDIDFNDEGKFWGFSVWD